ncbi:MAG: aminomethyltransferase beta-barrel domain-containing protein, partial [Pseudomonadota bacterium]
TRKREDGSYAYPQLTLHYSGKAATGGEPSDRSRAFGRLEELGTYTTTITRPDLFAPYLTEQLELIAAEYDVDVTVTRSRQEIPFPYVLDGEAGVSPGQACVFYEDTNDDTRVLGGGWIAAAQKSPEVEAQMTTLLSISA